ncbi:uncharacterized protein LOC130371630 isoform X3 [Gadus chalcogrammus]|uniref:uncharacterized protein LOC130371630 isoform X3 n=1 Tax=Gadus chalcogrammus TaxID=1042646 RepID=UPI0024C4DBCF|nr:uncharacterized protein LOC130371630 isoform X3 [Gadus chalcogrammus]
MAHEESIEHSSLYESSDPFPARLPFSKKKRVECKAWITNFTMKNTTRPGVTVQPGLLQLLGQQGADQCNERSIPRLVSCRARGRCVSGGMTSMSCQHATLWCLHQDGDRKKGRSTTVKQPNGK